MVQKGVDGIVLPKLETVDEIRAADWLIGNLERDRGLKPGAFDVIPILETAKGLANIRAIAAAGTRVKRFAFGAGDFTLDDEDAIDAYEEALEMCETLNLPECRASIQLAIADRYLEIGDLAAAKNYADETEKSLAKVANEGLKIELEELRRGFK